MRSVLTGRSSRDAISPSIERDLRAESLRYRADLTARGAGFWLTSFGLCLLLVSGSAEPLAVTSWIMASGLAFCIRFGVARRTMRASSSESLAQLDKRELLFSGSYVLMSAVVSSLPWALTSPVAIDVLVPVTLLHAFAVLGPFAYMSVNWISYAFGASVCLFQAILFWALQQDYGMSMAGIVAMLWVMLVSAARANAREFRTNFLMRHENRALLEKLNGEKRAAQEARKIAAVLRDDAEHARRLAELSNRTKSRFLVAATHDLRQPLFALSLYTNRLDQALPSAGKARDILRHIRESAAVLDALLKSLLELSATDANKLRPKISQFQVRDMLDRLRDEFDIQASAKGLELKVLAERAVVVTDRVLTERLLRNLLSNAIRHTETGEVRLLARRDLAAMVVEVQDDGPGIPTDEQGRVFDAFYQGEGLPYDRRGSIGMGLAIAERLSRVLSLDLTLESLPGAGTKFRLRIPVASDGASADEALSAVTLTSGIRAFSDEAAPLNATVLLVEDDTAVCEALLGRLEDWGCHAVAATSQEEISDLLRDPPYEADLWLLDDALGHGFTGLDIARSLVAAGIPSQRVVLMTGNPSTSRRSAIEEAGFRLLGKPIADRTLYEAIHAASLGPKAG